MKGVDFIMLSNFRNYSKIIIIIIVAAMVITGGLYGYGRFFNPNNNQRQRRNYVAEVNGTEITYEEFDHALRNNNANIQQRSQEVPHRFDILNSIIERIILDQKIEEMNITANVSDEDFETSYKQMLDAYEMTEEELKTNLDERGYTLEQYKESLREQLEDQDKINQAVTKHTNIEVTEEEVVNAYEEINIQMIVKDDVEDEEAKDTDKNVEEKMNEALNKIKGEQKFAEVAEEYSDLQLDEGKTGFIGHDNRYLSQDITEKVFDMEAGEMTGVIEDSGKYYIIKLLDKNLASGEEFEKQKESIENNLLQRKRQDSYQNWIENLKEDSNIQINDPLLSGYKNLEDENYGQAINDLETVVENYSSAIAYQYLASAYQKDGQIDKAGEILKEAVDEYKDDWELHYNYGQILAGDEESKEKAIKMFDKASELAGDDYMAHYNIYMGYDRVGAKEKAEAEMEVAQELMQEFKEQQDAVRESQELEAQTTDQEQTTETDRTTTNTDNSDKNE